MENSEIEQLLISIGLTKQEARCYLSLYKIKEAKTGELSKESSIATANIYPVLSNLIKNGLVSYRIQNNVKIFIANPPEAFNEFVEKRQKQLDEQKQKVKQTISQLNVSEIKNEPISNYRYYEGIPGIKSMWYEITKELDNLDKNQIIKIQSAKKGAAELLLGFYDEFHKERVKKKLGYQLITDFKLKEHGKRRSKLPKTEVRYLDLNNECTWGIIGTMKFIQYNIGKKPISFLIIDDRIAKTYEDVFDRLWLSAKKLKE